MSRYQFQSHNLFKEDNIEAEDTVKNTICKTQNHETLKSKSRKYMHLF